MEYDDISVKLNKAISVQFEEKLPVNNGMALGRAHTSVKTQ